MQQPKVPNFSAKNGFTTSVERSSLMKKIRANDTKNEILLRKALWSKGFRYRKNYHALPGKPDIVFLKKKIAIFIDGEFWHGFNWAIKKQKIKANRQYWIAKIERNIQRDLENNIALKSAGFVVIRFWEHEIKVDAPSCMAKILVSLSGT